MILKLYITGNTRRSERAIANLRRICEVDLAGDVEVQVIDVLEQPDMADAARVMATPTLIRLLPPPIRRIVGDLSDTESVMCGLDLQKTS